MSAAKRRIKQNVWGNWNGYEGNRKVIEFGTGEFEANEWLRGIEPEPAGRISLRKFDFDCDLTDATTNEGVRE